MRVTLKTLAVARSQLISIAFANFAIVGLKFNPKANRLQYASSKFNY
jgi:hypothetical protein